MNLEETYVSFNADRLDIGVLFSKFVEEKIVREE